MSGTCIEAEPFALRVLDDSMAPEFARGTVIVVDPSAHARHGAYVVAEFEGSLVLRALELDRRGVRLRALNPRYPCIELPFGLAAVRGVVVQRAGRRRRDHKRYD